MNHEYHKRTERENETHEVQSERLGPRLVLSDFAVLLSLTCERTVADQGQGLF
jgi:hypothetical protein